MIRRILAAASLTVLTSVHPAMAQDKAPARSDADAAAKHDSKSSDNSVAEVIVTGSRLKSEAPVGSALISVSRTDIESSTAANTSQLFLTLPQVNNLGITQNSRLGNGGAANFNFSQGLNIHGVGPYATLLLVDGQRLIPQGAYGLIVSDTSVIPMIALERLEVVADGASAIYGSDAVAGVANLILRRNFQGVETSASYGVADNYQQYEASIIGGHDWGTGHGMLAYSYSGNSSLAGRDRSFARADLRPFGGSDFRSTQCNPGNLVVGGVAYPIPAGGATPSTAGSLQPGARNSCDNFLDSYLVPEIKRHNVVATLNQEVNEDLGLHATGFYSRRSNEDRLGLTTSTLSVPSTNAFFVRPNGTTGPETVSYAFTELPQAAHSEGVSQLFHGNVGASLKLGKDWVASADFAYDAASDSYIQNRLLNPGALSAALASSDPATAFNPYGGANSTAVLSAISNFENDVRGRGRQWVADLSLSGTLFELPAGPVGLAVGYQHLFDKQYAFTTTTAGTGLVDRTVLDGRRNVDSAYAEIKVPLLSQLPGIYSLTADAAVRYDRFSDVGSTTNPKIGVDWEVVRGLRLHGSYSTSFRAPALYHVSSAGNSFYTTITDPQAGGAFVNALETFGAAATKPETARTYSFGVDFKPSVVPGFTAQLTYFDIKYDNVIASLVGNPQLLNQSYYSNIGIITRNPTAAQIAALVAQLPLLPGVVPPSVQVIADTRARNLGSVHAAGLDYLVSYEQTTSDAGAFTIGSSGTRYLKYKTAAAPGAPFVDLRGRILFPDRLVLRAYLGWRLDPIDVLVTVSHANSYINNLVVPNATIPAYNVVDLHVGYDLPKVVPLSRLHASVDVTNLLDRNPPFVNISPTGQTEAGFDATQASPIGRTISFSLTADF